MPPFLLSRMTRPIDLYSAGLNPAFLAERQVVLLELSSRQLIVGMADAGDARTIAGLRFATGLDIAAVQLSPAEISARLVDHTAFAAAETLLPAAFRNPESLFGRLTRRLGAGQDEAALEPLARLFEAGAGLAEAGSVLLTLHPWRTRYAPGLLRIAAQLELGQPLETALRSGGRQFIWLAEVLASCPAETDRRIAFARIIMLQNAISRGRAPARQALWELAALAPLAILAWWPIAPGAALAIVAAAILAWVHGRRLMGRGLAGDGLRAEILAVTEAMARLPVPPAVAIRAGLARLGSLVPSASAFPAERRSLALALELAPFDAALLQRGDLAEASARIAATCTARADASTNSFAWLVRLSASVLIAAAVVWRIL